MGRGRGQPQRQDAPKQRAGAENGAGSGSTKARPARGGGKLLDARTRQQAVRGRGREAQEEGVVEGSVGTERQGERSPDAQGKKPKDQSWMRGESSS